VADLDPAGADAVPHAEPIPHAELVPHVGLVPFAEPPGLTHSDPLIAVGESGSICLRIGARPRPPAVAAAEARPSPGLSAG
jgi:hypothetical protein